jgi:hypothetical protein
MRHRLVLAETLPWDLFVLPAHLLKPSLDGDWRLRVSAPVCLGGGRETGQFERENRLVVGKKVKGAFPGQSIGSLQVHCSTKLSKCNDLGSQGSPARGCKHLESNKYEQGETGETRPKRQRERPRM